MDPKPHTAHIGIGSNLDAPRANCTRSISLLEEHPAITVTARSSFYETEPVGRTSQSWFVNAVIEVSTTLDPHSLLEALLSIEKEMGRIRREKWGPRIIDLDLLLYEDRVIHGEGLDLPHPEMTKRRFVLVPLSEIAGHRVHPMRKKSIHALLAELPANQKVHRIVVST